MANSIQLQFSTTPEWQSAVIRCMCHSPFSHVDIMLPDGNMLGASDSPDAPVVSGNPRGVAIRPINYETYAYRRVISIKTDKADAIIAAAMTQLGKPFDNAALYGFLIDPLVDQDKTFMKTWIKPKLLSAFAEHFLDKVDDAYSLKMFLGGSLESKAWYDTAQWFCAELSVWSFARGKYWEDVQWPLKRISPTDNLLMFQFDENWENRNEFWNEWFK